MPNELKVPGCEKADHNIQIYKVMNLFNDTMLPLSTAEKTDLPNNA